MPTPPKTTVRRRAIRTRKSAVAPVPTPLPAPKDTTKDLLAKAARFADGVDIGRVAAAVDSRARRSRAA